MNRDACPGVTTFKLITALSQTLSLLFYQFSVQVSTQFTSPMAIEINSITSAFLFGLMNFIQACFIPSTSV